MICDHTAQGPVPEGPSHKATQLSRKTCPLAEGLAAASAQELGKGLSEPQAVVGLLAKGVITGKDTVFSVAAEEGMEVEQVVEGGGDGGGEVARQRHGHVQAEMCCKGKMHMGPQRLQCRKKDWKTTQVLY